jgi:hypothetical protein
MSTPIHVRNLPAAATEAQIRRLFWGFGRVSSVSIRKTDAAHAEGSVEMSVDQDAANAVLVLQGSHMGSQALDFSLGQHGADEVSWDGRAGGLSSRIHGQG